MVVSQGSFAAMKPRTMLALREGHADDTFTHASRKQPASDDRLHILTWTFEGDDIADRQL